MRWRIVSTSTVIAVLLGCPFGLTTARVWGGEAADGAAPVARQSRSTAPESRFVRDAQRALKDLGYNVGRVDGSVGPRTKSALLLFQGSHGLPLTGQLDSESMTRLDIYQRLFRARPLTDGDHG